MPVEGLEAAAGLNEKSGSADTDFWRCAWAEPRRPLGNTCRDMGRPLNADVEFASAVEPSGSRMGKVNSGLGMSSMGPALEACRRWYSGEPTPAAAVAAGDCAACVTDCRGRAI